jgi:hypothetical protein
MADRLGCTAGALATDRAPATAASMAAAAIFAAGRQADAVNTSDILTVDASPDIGASV